RPCSGRRCRRFWPAARTRHGNTAPAIARPRARPTTRVLPPPPPSRGQALTLRAMTIAAGVVGNLGVAAVLVLATLDMPAERRRAAALDGRHHLQLVEADVPGVGRPPRRPVVAEDIRDLQRWTGHSRRRLRRRLHFLADPLRFPGSFVVWSRPS